MPVEREVFDFDFTEREQIADDGRTISSAAVTQIAVNRISDGVAGVDAVTISDVTIVGGIVQCTISGGTDGYRYTLECRATLSDAQIIAKTGFLDVKQDAE